MTLLLSFEGLLEYKYPRTKAMRQFLTKVFIPLSHKEINVFVTQKSCRLHGLAAIFYANLHLFYVQCILHIDFNLE